MVTPENQEVLYAAIGKLIRTRRQTLRLTQEQLANSLSISRASIANIENGRQKLLVHTLFDFAAALQMEPAELLPRVGAAATINNLDSLNETVRNFVTTTIEGGQEGTELLWRSDEER